MDSGMLCHHQLRQCQALMAERPVVLPPEDGRAQSCPGFIYIKRVPISAPIRLIVLSNITGKLKTSGERSRIVGSF